LKSLSLLPIALYRMTASPHTRGGAYLNGPH
jgi:hypothetical protein